MKRALLLTTVFILFPLAVSSQDNLIFREAESHFAAGRMELAQEKYREVISRYPLSRYLKNAYYGEALSTLRLGRRTQGQELLLDYLKRYPSAPLEAPFWLGLSYYQEQKWETALVYLNQVTQDSSLFSEALRLKGVASYQQGDSDKALEILSGFFKDPQRREAYTQELIILFSLLLEKGEYQALVQLYSPLTPRDASDYQQLSLYASEAYLALGQREKSKDLTRSLLGASQEIAAVAYQRYFLLAQEEGENMEAFVRQAERDLAGLPGILKEFWLRVGIDYYQKKQWDKAEVYLWRVWDLREQEKISGTVPLYLSSLLEKKGDLTQALEMVEAFLTLSADKRGNLLFKAGSLNISLKRWEAGYNRFSLVLEEFPQFEFLSEARYLGAFALYKMGKPRESFQFLEPTFTTSLKEGLEAEVLRLKGQLEVRLGRNGINSYERYLLLVPEDVPAIVELGGLYYRKGQYQKVLNLKAPGSPQLSYLKGLSALQLTDYEASKDYLNTLITGITKSSEVYELKGYALFYAGWANYRLPDYPEAVRLFSQLSREFPLHPFEGESRYMAGWCSFNMGDFAGAEGIFRGLSQDRDVSQDRSLQSLQLLGKSLVNQNRSQEALLVYEGYLERDDSSPRAQEVALEAARILTETQGLEGGIPLFKKAIAIDPDSLLGEEAAFSIGEVQYQAGNFKMAQDAYYQYRISYPKGEYYDDALYWGGIAAQKLDESYGALLLWEELLDFSNSPYRSDALFRSAEIYAGEGDYREALRLYGELISNFPTVAKSLQAESRSEELRLLLLGLSDQEAQLSVTIGKEGGAKTEKGREAMVALSRLYIYESRGKQSLALKMLEDVIARQEEDPYWAAKAQFLMGEYFAREGDPLEAGKEYLKAASMNPKDRDLMAMSLYRAIDMSLQGGKRRDAESLFRQLKSYFSDSPWVEKGEDLLEGNR